MSTALATLGDAGAPNDDASYTGDVSTSPLSLDYFRTKIVEYQAAMNALDQGLYAAQYALQWVSDEETSAYLQNWISEFYGKRWQMKATAETLNMGAQVVNSLGGRMPSLSIPSTLGLPAIAVPAAAIAAAGVAASLVVWGREMLIGLNDRLKFAQALEAQTSPEAAAALAQSVMESDAAVKIAQESSVFALAPVVKYASYAVGAFLLWQFAKPLIDKMRG